MPLPAPRHVHPTHPLLTPQSFKLQPVYTEPPATLSPSLGSCPDTGAHRGFCSWVSPPGRSDSVYLPIRSLRLGGQHLPWDLTSLKDPGRAVGFSVCSACHLLLRQSHSFQAILEDGGQPCPTRRGGSSLGEGWAASQGCLGAAEMHPRSRF